jgi:hypothetical protein
VGSRYAREGKKTGIFGYKRFRVPVNKASLFKFHDVECSTQDSGARRGCSGSVSSQVVARVSAVGQRTVEPEQLVLRGESQFEHERHFKAATRTTWAEARVG